MAKSRIIQPEKTMGELALSSKWAFFALSEGGVDGTETGVIVSNDLRATTLVDHDLEAAVGTQWSAKDGWWTGNGSTEYIEGLTSDDATAMEEVFNLGSTSSALIWLQCNGSFASSNRLLCLGQNLGTPTFAVHGVEIETRSTGVARAFVRNGDGTPTIDSASPNTVSDASDHVVILLINRATQELIIYDDAGVPGSLAPDPTPGDLSSIGDIGGGAVTANKRFLIGAGLNGSNAAANFATGSIRRVGWINFGGPAIPLNINDIMTDLSFSGGIPVRSMQGI